MTSLFIPVPQRLSEQDGPPRVVRPNPFLCGPHSGHWFGAGHPSVPASRGAPHLPGSAASAGSSGTASACPVPCVSSLVRARSLPAAPCSPVGVGAVRGVQAMMHDGGGCPWVLGPQRQIYSLLSFPFSPPDLPSIPCVFQLWDQGVLTSSRMHDLRRSRSSLVREEWPWSLSARERKRLGGGGSRA